MVGTYSVFQGVFTGTATGEYRVAGYGSCKDHMLPRLFVASICHRMDQIAACIFNGRQHYHIAYEIFHFADIDLSGMKQHIKALIGSN